jgi:CBS domain-containing protein
MTIGNIMCARDKLVTAGKDEKVRTVVARLAERRIGAMPVVDGERLVGLFSERDVIYGLLRDGDALLDKPLAEAMVSDVVTVTRDTKIIAAISLMTRRRIRHLPVMEGEKLVGFVSIGDLVKSRIDNIESEAAAMRDYIQGA